MTRARRSPADPTGAADDRFLIACALANTGGVIAYLPLLALILPMRVEAIAGATRIGALTAIAVIGLVVASIANVAFGWLSDRAVARGGTRRRGIMTGLVLLALAYAAVAAADGIAALTVAVAAVQVAVNAVLAPTFALFADEVPDARKGTLGGLIAWAQPVASGLAALLVAAALPSDAVRLALVSLAAILCFVPLLLVRGDGAAAPGTVAEQQATIHGRGLAAATAARLLVQVAGSVVALYLLYYLESIASGMSTARVAARAGSLMTAATLVPLPLALAAGRWSDRTGRRRPFLLAGAILAAAALVVMAVADGWMMAAASYVVFTSATAVFLSLNAGVALQLLPDPRHRGRDMGLFNLANTVPAFVGPGFAWWLATPHDFSALLLVVGAITAAGGLTVLAIPEQRRRG